MMRKLKDRFIRFCRWIWQECKDIKTFLLLLLVIAVVYSPVWGGYLLYAAFKWKWASVMASACLVFWAGPFTPFFLICIGIKRWTEHVTKHHDPQNIPKPEKKIAYTKFFGCSLQESLSKGCFAYYQKVIGKPTLCLFLHRTIFSTASVRYCFTSVPSSFSTSLLLFKSPL